MLSLDHNELMWYWMQGQSSKSIIYDLLPDATSLDYLLTCKCSELWRSGPWFNIKMPSYQYRKSHCGDKTVVRSSYLHNGISYTGKMVSFYWISPQLPRKSAQILLPNWQFYLPRIVGPWDMYGRADSRLVPSQWETPLLRNTVSHWLGANLEAALCEIGPAVQNR